MATWKLNGPDGDLWTAERIASYFGWSKPALYKLIKAGLFPAGRDMPGGQKWTGEDVAAYLLLAGRWKPQDAETPAPDDD